MAFGKKMNLKRRKKKSLAQQSKQILILMTVILVIILGGCTYVLNKTSGQIYEQMSQMAQLYAQELDNRFLRISRNLFSTIMDTNETNSTFWGNVNLMKNGDYTEYAIGKLREEYFSSAWEYGTEYRIFLYTHDTDKLYQLSMSSDGNYTMSPDIAASIREQIDKLDEKTYAVKRKWDVLECDNEVYICKIAQKNGIALGCIVNVKSILEPFSKLSLGKHGYVSLVDQDEVCIGMLDQSGITTTEPLKIKVTITTGGPHIKIDFTGTCPQVRGPLNCVRPMALACIYYVVRAVTDPTIPPNSGTYRRFEVITPEGSLVNAVYPAATGSGNSITCQRLVDVLLGALAQVVPEKVCAAACGSMNGIQLGGYNPETHSFFANGETVGGGYGGMCDQDGTSGVNTHMTNTRNTPVEVLERIMPVKVIRYGLAPNSEGPGKHRGGFGIERVLEFQTDEVDCFIASDRVNTAPWGLNGGKAALGARFTVNRADGTEEHLPSKARVRFYKKDRLYIQTSGGGGWGNPLERDKKALKCDVKDGLISQERAEKEYGGC